MGRYVEDYMANPDRCAEHLFTAFQLSRSSIYRLLESVGGPAAFIRERRLSKAHELLTASRQARGVQAVVFRLRLQVLIAVQPDFRGAFSLQRERSAWADGGVSGTCMASPRESRQRFGSDAVSEPMVGAGRSPSRHGVGSFASAPEVLAPAVRNSWLRHSFAPAAR